MATPGQLAILRQGVEKWNSWQKENAEIINLSGANLSEANLGGADLSGACLIEANLSGASLIEANLSGADLHRADLSLANLSESNLTESNLGRACLVEANLYRATLNRANLLWANLYRATLHGANLSKADISHANLFSANLSDANLDSARLQGAIIDGAIATGVHLWETQRGGWSIKGIVCEWVYWGPDSTDIVQYAPGEFERLYSQQRCIELNYKGGITTFQLNALPLLLYRLTEENPGSTVRLSRVEEAAGGTKVVITVEEGDATHLQQDCQRIQEWQIKAGLHEQYANRVEGLFRELINSLPKLTEAATMKTNNLNGPVGNYIEGGSHHQVTNNQTIASTIQDIAAEAQRKSSELRLSAEDSQKLQSALANLNQQHSHPAGIVKESLLSVRHILEHAAGAMIGHEWLPGFVAKVEIALRNLGS